MKSSKRKGWVGLKGLKVKGAIGVYENEKKNGSQIVIDVWVYGDLSKAIETDSLQDTLNYESIAQIAMQEVKSGNHLLEPVANNILVRILNEVPKAEKAKIELRKLDPPMVNSCDASVIKLGLNRKKLGQ